MTRYLKCLEFWGLAKKNDAGNWDWFEKVPIYKTEHDYRTALNHSRKLLDTLAGFLSVDMRKPELFQKRQSLPLKTQDNLFLNDRVREHLKTGYPSLYAEIVDFDRLIELRNEIKEDLKTNESKIEKDRMLEYVASFRKLKRYAIPKKHWKDVEKLVNRIGPERQSFIERTEENYIKSFIKINNEMRHLAFKVNHGEPLLGSCGLCPKSKVVSQASAFYCRSSQN